MIPVHIFRANSFKNQKNEFEHLTQLLASSQQLKKLYGKIAILTDVHGSRLLKNHTAIEYDEVYQEIETVFDEVSEVDIAVIAAAQKLKDDFVVVDYKLFVAHTIATHDYMVYDEKRVSKKEQFNSFLDKGVVFYFDYEEEEITLYNQRIFRCTDHQITTDFFESYFSTLYKNKHLFNNESELLEFSLFLQQSYLFKIFQKYQIEKEVYVYAKNEELKETDTIEWAFVNYPEKMTMLLKSHSNLALNPTT